MSVQFLIGRAGSGKTQRIFDDVVRRAAEDPLGPPIYWLLPKQATFQVERRLAVDSGLPGLCRVLVLSFDQFGEMIRQQCGGSAIPQIDGLGRQMILGHLLRVHQDDLRFFRSVARQPGLAAQLDDAFAEFDRAGRSADDLHSSTNAAPDPFDPYSAKLHDLKLLYREYEKYLGNDRLDPHRRLTNVLDCIGHWPEMKTASVMVDEFLDLSAPERAVLLALARGGARLTISLLVDPASPAIADPRQLPAEMSVFHRTEATHRNLFRAFADAGVSIDAATTLSCPAVMFSQTLKSVERDFFSDVRTSAVTGEHLCLIEAADRRAEVDAVARHVGSLLDEGYRLRDIAVLARDLGPYHELIASSFDEHRIPCFIDRRRPANHHPLIKFVRLLPLLADSKWPNEAVIGLCKTGLLGVNSSEADELECYVQNHRISGSGWTTPEPWKYRPATIHGEDDETSGRLDGTRRAIVELLRPWSDAIASAENVSTIVAAMLSLFDRADLAGKLEQWIEVDETRGRDERAEEHARVWTALLALLQQMIDLLGPERVSPVEFADILETGLEKFDLGVTPPTVDEVLVGTIDRTRTPQIKVSILIGWNDGSFPLSPGIDAILSDSDREQLNVGGGKTRRLLDERFLAYYSLTRASERLCITRPMADDAGKRLASSSYWLRIRELFPAVEPRAIGQNDLETIGTPRQLTDALVRWIHSLGDQDADAIQQQSPRANLYQWALSQPPGNPLTTVRDRVWSALNYRNNASLNSKHVAALFNSPIRASVTQLESFAACPFQHFAGHVLRLRTADVPAITGSDMARLYSDVLGRVINDMILADRKWDGPSPRARPTIRKHVADIGRSLRDEIMTSSARNRYVLERAQSELELTVATQEAAAARGDFTPAIVGLQFGTDAEHSLPPFAVNSESGNEVRLSGRMDRVDFKTLANDSVAASVVSYRLGEKALPLDRVYHGLSLQLLTYLLVLQANGETLQGRPLTPAATFYVKLLRGIEGIDHPSDATPQDHPDFLLKHKMRGVMDMAFARDFDTAVETGASPIVSMFVNKGGEFGKRDQTDVAQPNEFAALLRLVRHRIGELVDRLTVGDIAVSPYRIGNDSPCAKCSYRSVCRFDPPVDGYRWLDSMKRSDVFNAITAGGGSA